MIWQQTKDGQSSNPQFFPELIWRPGQRVQSALPKRSPEERRARVERLREHARPTEKKRGGE